MTFIANRRFCHLFLQTIELRGKKINVLYVDYHSKNELLTLAIKTNKSVQDGMN